MKALVGSLVFLVALFLGWAAISLFTRCILPWWQAPGTTYTTLILAGMRFTNWQLLLPFGVAAGLALGFAICGFLILRKSP